MEKIKDIYRRYGLDTEHPINSIQDLTTTVEFAKTADFDSKYNRINILKLFSEDIKSFKIGDWNRLFQIDTRTDNETLIRYVFAGVGIEMFVEVDTTTSRIGFNVSYNKFYLRRTSASYFISNKRELVDELLEAISPGWAIKKSFISEEQIDEEIASTVCNETMRKLDAKTFLEDLYSELPELIKRESTERGSV